MMNNVTKGICEDLMNEGKVTQLFDGMSFEGIHVESWLVKVEDGSYIVTKNDGEWVYFTAC